MSKLNRPLVLAVYAKKIMNKKRSAEETVPLERRTRIKLASPSPERTSGSDTESIHSYQGYKTEIANDTSDTSSPQLPLPGVEYEVAQPENQNPKFFSSDDSIEEDFQGLSDFLLTTSNDSLDKALLGDTSEENSTSPTSNSDVDPGLPRNDYLDFEKCLLCSTDKKDISYPYCSSCFTWRKNFYPSRPKKRKKYFKRAEQCPGVLNKCGNTSVSQNDKNESICLKKKITNGNLSDGLFEDSGVGSIDPHLSEDTVDGPSQPSTSSSHSTNSPNLKDSEVCRVCFLKRENGLFVHSNSAHLYGCYRCAKEIWYNNGGCPICRRKVFKITKLYV